MNRRSFFLGLLSTTAVPVVARTLPTIGMDLASGPDQTVITLMRTGLPNITWRKINNGVPWTRYDSIYNGVPIRQVDSIVEMLTRENEILKDITGNPYTCYDEASDIPDEMWEVDDD